MGVLHSRGTRLESDVPELTIAEVEKRRCLDLREVDFLHVVPHGVYADLSAHVYQHRGVDTTSALPVNAAAPLPDGWDVLMDCTSADLNKEGYYAVAYVNRALRQCVIAQRGTTEVMALRAAIWIYFEELTIQFFLAEQFSKQVRLRLKSEIQNKVAEEWFITYTGHSLGAVIATYRALEEDTLAVTFEPPGCRSFVQKYCTPAAQARVDASVVTYLHPPNLINSLRPHCGYVVEMMTDEGKNPTNLMFPITPVHKAGGDSEGSLSTTTTGNARQGSRFRLASFRPQEYLRGYVLGSVGMGVPEIQQYVSKVEPVLREMVEHAYQLHSIQNMRQHFTKRDESKEERVVVRWPSHCMQFLEYYNTLRSLRDPENASPEVRAAFTAMVQQLHCSEERNTYRLPLKYISRETQRVVEFWWLADARTRKSMPLSLIDHKALNVIRLDKGELVTKIITALQAKFYLEQLIRRTDIADVLRHLPTDLVAPSAGVSSKL